MLFKSLYFLAAFLSIVIGTMDQENQHRVEQMEQKLAEHKQEVIGIREWLDKQMLNFLPIQDPNFIGKMRDHQQTMNKLCQEAETTIQEMSEIINTTLKGATKDAMNIETFNGYIQFMNGKIRLLEIKLTALKLHNIHYRHLLSSFGYSTERKEQLNQEIKEVEQKYQHIFGTKK